MINLREGSHAYTRPALFLTFLVVAFAIGYTRGGAVSVPENSHPKSNGNGWACDRGHREVGNACVPDEVASPPGLNGCDGARPGVVTEVRRLELENDRLKRQIAVLSLQNSVLRTEADDDR